MVEIAQKSHGASSEFNSVFSLENVDQWKSIRTSAIQSRSCPMWFLGFFNHGKGAPRQEISKWSMVCSTFLRSRWSIVRSELLAKGGTSKRDCHCTFTESQLDVIRWIHELYKWPSYSYSQKETYSRKYSLHTVMILFINSVWCRWF
jgi:hypothetical protein